MNPEIKRPKLGVGALFDRVQSTNPPLWDCKRNLGYFPTTKPQLARARKECDLLQAIAKDPGESTIFYAKAIGISERYAHELLAVLLKDKILRLKKNPQDKRHHHWYLTSVRPVIASRPQRTEVTP